MPEIITDIRFGHLATLFNDFLYNDRDNLILLTSSVLRPKIDTLLSEDGITNFPFRWIEVPIGETCKSFSVIGDGLPAMSAFDANPDTVLVAIGGGSVSDLAGLVAHLWMRGIRLVIVPTTLLAMIDASIGGKNAIDLEQAKNVLGSFHTPELIFCDMRWLESLSPSDLYAGFAEAVKHAVIDGEEHLRFLETASTNGLTYYSLDISAWEDLVRRSQQVKLRYVRTDPFDRSVRHVLNYGHTFGHAIELLTGIPHGLRLRQVWALQIVSP